MPARFNASPGLRVQVPDRIALTREDTLRHDPVDPFPFQVRLHGPEPKYLTGNKCEFWQTEPDAAQGGECAAVRALQAGANAATRRLWQPKAHLFMGEYSVTVGCCLARPGSLRAPIAAIGLDYELCESC
jgi:hypothetical protein